MPRVINVEAPAVFRAVVRYEWDDPDTGERKASDHHAYGPYETQGAARRQASRERGWPWNAQNVVRIVRIERAPLVWEEITK